MKKPMQMNIVLPAQMRAPYHIVELLLNIAYGFSARNISLSIKNGGLTMIRMQVQGRDDCASVFAGIATRLRKGESISDYKLVENWEDALVYLSGCSSWRYAYFDETQAGWIAMSRINGKQKEEHYRGENGFELMIINAFSYAPELYRELERDYVQTMYIVDRVRHFCLSNTHTAFYLESNGKPFFSVPGSGSLQVCLEHLFSRELVHQIQKTERHMACGSFRALYLPAAVKSIEHDLAVVWLNGAVEKAPFVLPVLQKYYGNVFSSEHFVFVIDIDAPEMPSLSEKIFLEILSQLPVRRASQKKLVNVIPSEGTMQMSYPPFLAQCSVERAVLPDIHGKFRIEKVFDRFVLIRQYNYLYLFDYMELLTHFRMLEIQQEYQNGSVLITPCHIAMNMSKEDNEIRSAEEAACLKLGFRFDRKSGVLYLLSYPYYLKTSMAPDIALNLLRLVHEQEVPSLTDMFYLIAYNVVAAENSNRIAATTDNVVFLLEMTHRIQNSGHLQDRNIPVFRIGCNPYGQQDRESSSESK